MKSPYRLVNGPLRHDGVLYRGEDNLPALTEDQAAPLLAIGVIESVKKTAKDPSNPPEPPDHPEPES
jgi:hypothetical protein